MIEVADPTTYSVLPIFMSRFLIFLVYSDSEKVFFNKSSTEGDIELRSTVMSDRSPTKSVREFSWHIAAIWIRVS